MTNSDFNKIVLTKLLQLLNIIKITNFEICVYMTLDNDNNSGNIDAP